MDFQNFEMLVKQIETDLGDNFIQKFREARRKFAGLTNLPNWTLFSEYDKDRSEWVYNRGGKKEIQYHLYLRNGELGYGLGINSQRGSFNNDDPVKIANSFGSSFKELYTEIKDLLPDYTFQIGSEGQLGKMKEEEFLLFGNSIPYLNDNKLSDTDYQSLISDLKNQFEVYCMVFELYNKKKDILLRQERQREKIIQNVALLKYKKQIILQGPPGTGKTRAAKLIAKEVLGLDDVGDLKDSDQFTLIQFHPSYTYEDFVRGIVAKPNKQGTGILYDSENKVLGDLANRAISNPTAAYVIIIDEINRANLSSVLGELIYALEYRGEAVGSMYAIEGESKNKLILPPNLYIIGTMNTADRSVGHIDYAIRRRFAFVDILPRDLTTDNTIKFDGDLFRAVKELFTTDDYKTHSNYLSREFEPKDVALGHSYFIQHHEKDTNGNEDKTKPVDFKLRLEYEIKPILREYVKDGVLVGENIKQAIEKLNSSI